MKSTSEKTKNEQSKQKKPANDECSDASGKSPIVKVKFTPPNNFEFSCTQVTMRAAGKIQLHQVPSDDPWIFVSVNELPSPEFMSTIAGDGKTATVSDDHKSLKEYHYSITIRDATGEHTSGDLTVTNPPMIRNQ
jgi:virulence-associated protein VagC